VYPKKGLFELADKGTIFFDEIGNVPADTQAKLLRVIQEREFMRLGGVETIKVDVRIIAATNADLSAEVREGRFREDLFYRLNVVSLHLPALKERGDDVVLLADAFLKKFSAQYGLAEPPLTADVRRVLLAHSWPGNVRELRNAIERALLLSPAGSLELDELSPAQATHVPDGELPFPARLDDIVRAAARAMLQATGGNRSEAARRLGISRSRLQRLLGGGEPGAEPVSE
jgi:two-component system, NtrC family, response regulator HydG